MHLLALPRHELRGDTLVSPRALVRLGRMVARVRAGEPPQHVTGSAPFLDFDLHVTRRVLVPRPETEELVGRAIARLRTPPRLILDYGTGSGCIAIALARRYPDARVIAADSSAPALSVARRNAARLGVGAQVRFVRCFTLAASALARRRGRLDLLISNPPYIPTARLTRLDRRVRGFEPRTALDGGPKGTKIVAMLLEEGPRLLRPDGLLAVEVDSTHHRFIRGIAPAAEIERDLAGRTRYAFLRRTP